jgi:hypothetical protein
MTEQFMQRFNKTDKTARNCREFQVQLKHYPQREMFISRNESERELKPLEQMHRSSATDKPKKSALNVKM